MKDTTSPANRMACCIGKATFSTPQLAHKAQRRRGKKRDNGKRPCTPYRCCACGFFHIGTQAKSRHASSQREHGGDADMV